MFGFYNLRRTFNTEKRNLLFSLIIFFIGFVMGILYANFSEDDVFFKSLRITDGYLKNENSFSYSFNDEISLFGIFFGGFFVFGKSIVSFFIFKSGYMLGYFLSFLIKAYSTKGMFTGIFYLFLSLVFCLPWQFLLSAYAFDCCGYTYGILFKKHNSAINIKSFFYFFVLFFFLCLILTFFGNFLRTKFFSEFIKKIFT